MISISIKQTSPTYSNEQKIHGSTGFPTKKSCMEILGTLSWLQPFSESSMWMFDSQQGRKRMISSTTFLYHKSSSVNKLKKFSKFLKYFFIVLSIKSNILLIMYNMKLETIDRGRPRSRWIEGGTDTLRVHNITAHQMVEKHPVRKLIINKASNAKQQNTEMDTQNKNTFPGIRYEQGLSSLHTGHFCMCSDSPLNSRYEWSKKHKLLKSRIQPTQFVYFPNTALTIHPQVSYPRKHRHEQTQLDSQHLLSVCHPRLPSHPALPWFCCTTSAAWWSDPAVT